MKLAIAICCEGCGEEIGRETFEITTDIDWDLRTNVALCPLCSRRQRDMAYAEGYDDAKSET